MYVTATPSASATANGPGSGSYGGACETVARSGRERG